MEEFTDPNPVSELLHRIWPLATFAIAGLGLTLYRIIINMGKVKPEPPSRTFIILRLLVTVGFIIIVLKMLVDTIPNANNI